MWYNRKTPRRVLVAGSRMKKRRMPPLKRAAKRARREVGLPLSMAPTTKQRTQLSEGAIIEQNRTLYNINMTSIPQGNLPNEREKNKVNILGIKVRWFVQNSTGAPIYFRYALVAPKNATTIGATNFFHGADGAARGLDFANTRNGVQFCFSGINPDLFHILKSGVVKLIGNTSTDNKGNNTQLVQFYYPLKRVITWDDNTSATPTGDSVFFIWWYDNPLNGAGIAASNVALRGCQLTTYFRDD